jgi:hypothetical protein
MLLLKYCYYYYFYGTTTAAAAAAAAAAATTTTTTNTPLLNTLFGTSRYVPDKMHQYVLEMRHRGISNVARRVAPRVRTITPPACFQNAGLDFCLVMLN